MCVRFEHGPGGRFDDIDIVLVRENLGGLYVAFEHYIPIGDDPHAVAISTGVNTREGSRKIIEFAFDYALKNGRKKVTVVHKANVLKALTGVFSRSVTSCEEIRGQGPDGRSHRRCDRDAARHESLAVRRHRHHQFVRRHPVRSARRLVGGLGMAPGANIGPDAAIFEAVHGSAPISPAKASPIHSLCCWPSG
jgi:Isocitrate/isopropylmalate dehydrogenase